MNTVSVEQGDEVLDTSSLTNNNPNTPHKGEEEEEEEEVANSPVKEPCSDQQTESTVSRRGKRRRVECKKYTGFVVQSLHKTAPSISQDRFINPSNSIEQPRPTGPGVKTKRHKQLKDEQSLELVRNTRQRHTLRVCAKDQFIEHCESEKLAKGPLLHNSKIGVKKCTRPPISSGKQKCSDGSQETKNSKAITSPDRQSDKAINADKVKRKHALCAIFDNIWGSETTEAQVNIPAEKPLTNGFRELFDKIFHKVSPVRVLPVEEEEEEERKRAGPRRSCRNSLPLKSPEKEGSGNSNVVEAVSTPPVCNPPSVVGCELSVSPLSHQVKIESSRSSDVKTDVPPSSPSSTAISHPCAVKPPSSLRLSQSQCEARSKQISLQLTIKKTLLPAPVIPDHRKKRKLRCRKRKQPSHVTDADDEHSEGGTSAPTHFALMTGPLKNISIEDLWVQKEFYLRYLCNYYHISNEGCKEWLVSRLHQFILQTIGGTSLTKPRNFKYKPVRRSGGPTMSWVALNVNYKIKLLE